MKPIKNINHEEKEFYFSCILLHHAYPLLNLSELKINNTPDKLRLPTFSHIQQEFDSRKDSPPTKLG